MLQKSSPTSLWLLGTPALPQRTLSKQPRQAFVAISLIVGVVLILCLYLYQTSRITATNYATLQLQFQYARYQRENSNLLADYASEQTVAKMSQRAQVAGFGPPRTVQYVAGVTVRPVGEPSSEDAAPPAPLSITQRPQ